MRKRLHSSFPLRSTRPRPPVSAASLLASRDLQNLQLYTTGDRELLHTQTKAHEFGLLTPPCKNTASGVSARANCMRATSAAQATTPGRLELAGAGELVALLAGSFTSRSAPHTPTVVSASSIIGNSTSTPAASWSRPIERPMLRAVSFMILNFKQHVKIYLFTIHGCRGRVTTRALVDLRGIT